MPTVGGKPHKLVNQGAYRPWRCHLLENPMVASLSRVDISAQNIDDSSPKEDEDNDVDTFITM